LTENDEIWLRDQYRKEIARYTEEGNTDAVALLEGAYSQVQDELFTFTQEPLYVAEKEL